MWDFYWVSFVIKGGFGYVNWYEGLCDFDVEEEEDVGVKFSIVLINFVGVFKESDVGEGEKNFMSIFFIKSFFDGVFEDIWKVLLFGLFLVLVNKFGIMFDN